MRKGDKMSFCQVFVNVGHSGHTPMGTNPRNAQSFQHGRSIGCVKRTGRAFGFISQEKNSDLYFSVDDVIEVYPLKVGEVVTFECHRTPKGLVAKRIKRANKMSPNKRKNFEFSSARFSETAQEGLFKTSDHSIDRFLNAYNSSKEAE